MRAALSTMTIARMIGGCFALAFAVLAARAQADPLLRPGSLVISSSTYDNSQGAVASLHVGTTLPDSDTQTTAAVACSIRSSCRPIRWSRASRRSRSWRCT